MSICIHGCEFFVAFEHVTSWFMFIIIIIIARCTSKRVRWSHFLPNPPVTCHCLGHIPALTPCFASLSFDSPSPSGLWSSFRRFTFWCPPNAAKQSFTPSLLSMFPNQFHLLLCTWQLISSVPAISTTLLFVILSCHLILSIGLRHILALLPIPLAAHTFHSLQNAPRAFCSLFLISLLPPPPKIGLFNLNTLLQVQLHMTQQNKHREIQKKFGQQQVQL